MKKQKTAVEWYVDEICRANKKPFLGDFKPTANNAIDDAFDLFKYQMRLSFIAGRKSVLDEIDDLSEEMMGFRIAKTNQQIEQENALALQESERFFKDTFQNINNEE